MQANTQQQREAGAAQLLLPSAQDLTDKLKMLAEAQYASDYQKAQRIGREIKEMVTPGIYEGYLGDDLRVSFCQVFPVQRRNVNANPRTYFLTLRELDVHGPNPVGPIQEMDLIDFLGEVNRQRKGSDSRHIGPRFWRL